MTTTQHLLVGRASRLTLILQGTRLKQFCASSQISIFLYFRHHCHNIGQYKCTKGNCEASTGKDSNNINNDFLFNIYFKFFFWQTNYLLYIINKSKIFLLLKKKVNVFHKYLFLYFIYISLISEPPHNGLKISLTHPKLNLPYSHLEEAMEEGLGTPIRSCPALFHCHPYLVHLMVRIAWWSREVG